MQITEHIAKKRRDARRLTRIAIFGAVVVLAPASAMTNHLAKNAVFVVLMVLLGVTLLASAARAVRIKCPRCPGILPSQAPSPPELHCPECGSDFRQQMT